MVRAFIPQGFVGNVKANTNFPPQGEIFGGITPEEISMLFEDGITMEYEDTVIMEYE